MSNNTVSQSQAGVALSVLLAGLVACNAFAMCSDVLSSLLFAGVTGYISLALLVIVFLLWLNLYLCGGKPLNPFDLEKDYYCDKFIMAYPQYNDEHFNEYKQLVENWLRLAEYRNELVRFHEKNRTGSSNIDEAYDNIAEKLCQKWQKRDGLSEAQAEAFQQVVTSYRQTLSKKNRDASKQHYFAFSEDDFQKENMQKIFSTTQATDEWFSMLKTRETALFRQKYILLGVSMLALANVLINALTMFGGAQGVVHTVAILCGIQVPAIVTQIAALLFLGAGGYASYQLTRPMIRHFGYDLELYFQDVRHFHQKFSWLNVLAGLMAFFSAIASATFALYNTPLVGMLPVALVGCAPLIQGFVFVIAFFSVFSLYFVSVTSKFRDWQREQAFRFDMGGVCSLLVILAASLALDMVYFPGYLHGFLELFVLLEATHAQYGKKGVLFTISLFGSFAFCLTSFHQICLLFHPGPIMLALSSVVTIFQFATFAVTFYYGCCRRLSVDTVELPAPAVGFATPHMKPYGRQRSPTSVTHAASTQALLRSDSSARCSSPRQPGNDGTMRS